jgi:hypothetical protein
MILRVGIDIALGDSIPELKQVGRDELLLQDCSPNASFIASKLDERHCELFLEVVTVSPSGHEENYGCQGHAATRAPNKCKHK